MRKVVLWTFLVAALLTAFLLYAYMDRTHKSPTFRLAKVEQGGIVSTVSSSWKR